MILVKRRTPRERRAKHARPAVRKWFLGMYPLLLVVPACHERTALAPELALRRVRSAWKQARYLLLEVYEHDPSETIYFVTLADEPGPEGNDKGNSPTRTCVLANRQVIQELANMLRDGRRPKGTLGLAPTVTIRVYAVGNDSAAVILVDGVVTNVQERAGSENLVSVAFDCEQELFSRLVALTKDVKRSGVTRIEGSFFGDK